MLVVAIPNADEILALQDLEGALYYSTAIEDVLRREGVVSVVTREWDDKTPMPAGARTVFARGVDLDRATLQSPDFRPVAFEGPLTDRVLKWLGLTARVHYGKNFTIHGTDKSKKWPVFRPSAVVGTPGAEVKAPRKWTNKRLAIQLFEDIPPEAVLLHLTTPKGKTYPVVFRHNGIWISALPLFDLIAQHFSFPPLNQRYQSRVRPSNMQHLSAELSNTLLATLHASADAVSVWAERWPSGYKSAFTMRHDYDRPITQQSHDELLALYSRLNMKCSIAWLGYLLPEERIRDFAAQRHEVQIHAYEKSEAEMAATVAQLGKIVAKPIYGATVHGGHTSIGFRGDVQFAWMENAGLGYVESFSLDAKAAPIYRRDLFGILRRSAMIASPMHSSLDETTLAETTRLDIVGKQVRQRLDQGGIAMVMNHPDLNRVTLTKLLEDLPRDGVWFATLGEICGWERVTKYDPVVAIDGDTVRVNFAQALPYPAVVHVKRGSAAAQAVTIPAGATAITVNARGAVRTSAEPVNADLFVFTPRDRTRIEPPKRAAQTATAKAAVRGRRLTQTALARARRFITGT